jgi:hypothetical protein
MIKYENNFKVRASLMALLLAGAVAGCGGGDGGGGGGGGGGSSGAVSTTGTVCTAGPACVSLGAAGNLAEASGYGILAKTGVSTVPGSRVTGNIGLSPTARVGLTGWSETSDVTDTFSTSAQVVAPGRLYASDYVGGTTSADLSTAVGSMQLAYTEAAGKPAGVGPNLNLGAGTVAGQTLAPGVYTWGTAVNITTDLTLNGSATDVWVFQVAGTLDMAADTKVLLTGGALPQNVFWQVSGAVSVGARTQFAGIVLGQTGITFGNLSSIAGRLLAQTAVVLDMTTVTVPQ